MAPVQRRRAPRNDPKRVPPAKHRRPARRLDPAARLLWKHLEGCIIADAEAIMQQLRGELTSTLALLLKDEPPTALVVFVSIPDRSAVLCRLSEIADIAELADGVMPPHRIEADGRVSYPTLVFTPGDVLLWFRSNPA